MRMELESLVHLKDKKLDERLLEMVGKRVKLNLYGLNR